MDKYKNKKTNEIVEGELKRFSRKCEFSYKKDHATHTYYYFGIRHFKQNWEVVNG